MKYSINKKIVKGKAFGYSLFLFILFLLQGLSATAQNFDGILIIKDLKEPIKIGKHSYIFVDSTAHYTPADIDTSTKFTRSNTSIPILQVSKGNIWIRFSLQNKTKDSSIFLNFPYANISLIEFYKVEDGVVVKKSVSGNGVKFVIGTKISPGHIFNLHLKVNDAATFYIRINSKHPVLLPMLVEAGREMEYSQSLQTIFTGLYAGIFLAIILYNFFLFISTRDKNYFIYICFLFFLGIAQIILAGYAFPILWPSVPELNVYALTLSSSLAGILGIVFAIYFLRTRFYLPKIMPLLYFVIAAFFVCIILSLAGNNHLSYNLLSFTSIMGGGLLIILAAKIAKKGYRPASFYLVAWLSFLLGMIIFSFRNLDLLPYNFFTTYITYIGSAVEAILLSIALADNINILRKEKEMSQADALRASQENERLVKEQNLELEHKVSERTQALTLANSELTMAYQELKDAEIQLVEAEKMASLGQLTAGIAHEINNPINFVKSNIKPLQLDIKDMIEVIDEYEKLHHTDKSAIDEQLKKIEKLKKEIDLDFVKNEIQSLMVGIEEGAERTAEIVRGLRTFSRLDESQIKTVNIHEGIESTLVLLRSNISMNIKLIKKYEANGNIECFPGKLNQVFMNIINNAMQAVKEKKEMTKDEYIMISTADKNDNEIEIRIKDSGVGMSAEVKQKIFDPFFTTKDVGEGTGLGLAIVFKIIKEHGGKIIVNSSEGNGSEFILTLFHSIPITSF